MRDRRIEMALLSFFTAGLTLAAGEGCASQRSASSEVRSQSPLNLDQRLAAYKSAHADATVGVVNAVVPDRHIVQIQGISPDRVEIGQAIVIAANGDSRNPIPATVYDKQFGYVQLRYADGSKPRVPRWGDIAFCYLATPTEPEQVQTLKKPDLTSPTSAPAGPSLSLLPPELTGIVPAAPATQPSLGIDSKQTAATQPADEVKPAPEAKSVPEVKPAPAMDASHTTAAPVMAVADAARAASGPAALALGLSGHGADESQQVPPLIAELLVFMNAGALQASANTLAP